MKRSPHAQTARIAPTTLEHDALVDVNGGGLWIDKSISIPLPGGGRLSASVSGGYYGNMGGFPSAVMQGHVQIVNGQGHGGGVSAERWISPVWPSTDVNLYRR